VRQRETERAERPQIQPFAARVAVAKFDAGSVEEIIRDPLPNTKPFATRQQLSDLPF